MAQLESLDGKKYDVPDDVLARYKIAAETVGQNMQHHDLPIAPKPQEGWDDYGFDDMPQEQQQQPQQQMIQPLENSQFVRVQRGENNSLIINVVLPGAQ